MFGAGSTWEVRVLLPNVSVSTVGSALPLMVKELVKVSAFAHSSQMPFRNFLSLQQKETVVLWLNKYPT